MVCQVSFTFNVILLHPLYHTISKLFYAILIISQRKTPWSPFFSDLNLTILHHKVQQLSRLDTYQGINVERHLDCVVVQLLSTLHNKTIANRSAPRADATLSQMCRRLWGRRVSYY